MHPTGSFVAVVSCVFVVTSLLAGPPKKTPSSRQIAADETSQRDQAVGKESKEEKEGVKKPKDEKPKDEKPKKKEPQPFKWVNPLPENHHPDLEHHIFRSPSLRVDVGYCILLPPDYADTDIRYPVVYYLHGGRPGSESKSHALVPLIRDTMVSKKLPPMIYVFVNGGPVSHYNMPDQPTAQGVDVFTKELIPHVDTTYRTIASRRGRALEGFSQGGRGTMRISLRYPELFAIAAAGGGGYETEKRISESGGYETEKLKFSEGDNTWDLARAYAAAKDAPKVRWMIYVGTEGFNYENNLGYMAFLDSLGIKYRKVIVPDVPHSATGIYEKKAAAIMKFHARKFARLTISD